MLSLSGVGHIVALLASVLARVPCRGVDHFVRGGFLLFAAMRASFHFCRECRAALLVVVRVLLVVLVIAPRGTKQLGKAKPRDPRAVVGASSRFRQVGGSARLP
jgi:hypothetical protein